MKGKDKLDVILEEIQGISKRVEALEKAPPHECSCKKHDTINPFAAVYPAGFATFEDLEKKAPQLIAEHEEDMLAGRVCGFLPDEMSFINPIVPMVFHDGELGYATGEIVNGKVAFSTLTPKYPVIIGNRDQANGIYVPFDMSPRGAEVAKRIVYDIAEEIKILEQEKEQYQIFCKANGLPLPDYK